MFLPYLECQQKHCFRCGFCQHAHSASCRAAVAAVAVAVVEVAAMVAAIAVVTAVEGAAVVAAVAVAVVAVGAIHDDRRNDKIEIREPMTTEIVLTTPEPTAEATAIMTEGGYCSAIWASH